MIEAHSQLASYPVAATSARSGLSRALDNSTHPEFSTTHRPLAICSHDGDSHDAGLHFHHVKGARFTRQKA
jgi:hypothetical protein